MKIMFLANLIVWFSIHFKAADNVYGARWVRDVIKFVCVCWKLKDREEYTLWQQG